MSTSYNDKDLLSSLEQLFARYLDEKDDAAREKTKLDKFWGTYLRSMKDEDEARPRDWDGNTGSILTFTGLFAATVAAFVIESYKTLSPDSGEQTVMLLSRLLVEATNSTIHSTAVSASIEPFHAPLPAILANALWFCSLVVALACALLATLVQQWSRDYVKDIKRRVTLDENIASRALNHVYIRMGVDRYGMDQVVNLIVSLVHLAVVLFAAGLLLFLYPINAIVSWCTSFALALFGSAYLIVGMLPVLDTGCPYRTPLTYPMVAVYQTVLHVRRYALRAPFFAGAEIYYRTGIQWFIAAYTPVRHMLRSLSHIPTRRHRICWLKHITLRGLFPPNVAIISGGRRYFRDIRGTLTVPYFGYIWKHTSRQLLMRDVTDVNTLLQAVLDILGPQLWDWETRLGCIDLLYNDSILALRLDDIGRLGEGSPDPDTRIATLKLTCLLLRHAYRKWMWEIGGNPPFHTMYYLAILLSTIADPQGARKDERFALQARFCMFHLRWSLLLLVQGSALSGGGPSGLDIPGYQEMYFSQRLEVGSNGWFRHKHALLGVPRVLLLLANSWQYNRLDLHYGSVGHVDSDWSTDTTSCLVPLHDDQCCRSREGPLIHIAACTILTMVAHLLRASEMDRKDLYQHHVEQYGDLWEHGMPFVQWRDTFRMNIDDRLRAPSPEFLAVLHSAGLDEWARPGGNLEFIPAPDTDLGRFLAAPVDQHMALPISFADILRTLVKHVNLTDVRNGNQSTEGHQQRAVHNSTAAAAIETGTCAKQTPMSEEPSGDPDVDRHPGAGSAEVELQDTSIGLGRVVIASPPESREMSRG
ncbi:unnamed protein product [Peniophora sp. CBMAI 1063]|nr:unnamed protein product [Peniophora sp. CBMAI 1063]